MSITLLSENENYSQARRLFQPDLSLPQHLLHRLVIPKRNHRLPTFIDHNLTLILGLSSLSIHTIRPSIPLQCPFPTRPSRTYENLWLMPIRQWLLRVLTMMRGKMLSTISLRTRIRIRPVLIPFKIRVRIHIRCIRQMSRNLPCPQPCCFILIRGNQLCDQ